MSVPRTGRSAAQSQAEAFEQVGSEAPLAFAELLRRLRVEAGLTQEVLAERAGLSVNAISALERGTRQAPHRDTVQLLADALTLQPETRAALGAAASRPRTANTPAASRVVPAASPAPAGPSLPASLTSFVGRERELATVCSLIAEGRRLVTLTGPGGVGKTRLAIEAAGSIAHNFPGGVYFVDLTTIGDAALVPQTVATQLGVRAAPGRSIAAAIVARLRGPATLLVLDNCEHLLAECAALTATLVRDCPDLVVLVTSREALRLRGEQLYLVPPLALPQSGEQPAAGSDGPEATAPAAVRLFVDRARALRPEFVLSAANVGAVHEVCRRLDGLPLAIEIVAAQVRVLSPEQIAQRLSSRLAAVVAHERDLDPRHRTLRALIDWSYDRLTAAEQTLLRRLAVFAGGYAIDAIDAVCAGAGLPEDDLLDVLSALIEKSLVVADLQQTTTRYRLLDSIREYGLEQLTASGEAVSLRRAHAEYFAALAERGGGEGPAWGVVSQEVEANLANVHAALDYCRTVPGGSELLLRFTAALGYFWFLQGLADEGRAWCELALAQPEAALRPDLRVRTLFSAGHLAWDQEDLPAARTLLGECVAGARRAGDSRWLARALYTLGEVHWSLGEFEEARRAGEESAACAQAAGHRWELGIALQRLGLQAFRRGDLAAARERYEQSLGHFRTLAALSPAAYVERHLGYVALAEGRYREAWRHISSSLDTNRAIGDLRGVAGCLAALAGLAVALNQPELAARLAGATATAIEHAGAATLNPGDRFLYERTLEAIRAALGADRFAAGEAAGRPLTVDAAVALAAGGLGQPVAG